LLEKETNRNSKIIGMLSHDGDPKVLKTQYYLASYNVEYEKKYEISKIINELKKQDYFDGLIALEISTKIEFTHSFNSKEFINTFNRIKEIVQICEPSKSVDFQIQGIIRKDDISLIKNILTENRIKTKSLTINFDESSMLFAATEDNKIIKVINYKSNTESFFKLDKNDVFYHNIYRGKPLYISKNYSIKNPNLVINYGEKSFEINDIKKLIFYKDAFVCNNTVFMYAGTFDDKNQICAIDLNDGKLIMQKEELNHIDLFKEISNFQKPNQSPK
jgi:hypothetical protein